MADELNSTQSSIFGSIGRAANDSTDIGVRSNDLFVRPIIKNPDGSFSTERTITIQDQRINDGRWTNIPTIYSGKALKGADDEAIQQQAIEIIANNQGIDPDTNKKLRSFDTLGEAEAYARSRTDSLGKEISSQIKEYYVPPIFTEESLKGIE